MTSSKKAFWPESYRKEDVLIHGVLYTFHAIGSGIHVASDKYLQTSKAT